MASTILYKFRSGTTFEPLPLPGTSARLFDVKRAIVRAKKLDSSASNTSLEFDLAIQNAATNEAYDDESMILPRGTRIVVRRVAAERGRGILSRMAQPGGGALPPAGGGGLGGSAVPYGFYTIRSRDREADDEFLDAAPPPQSAFPAAAVEESKELEALRAVTDQAGSVYGSTSSTMMPPMGRGRDPRVAGQGAPPPHFAKPPPMMMHNNNYRHRPNADPELRMQEMMNMPQPKRRATGIPRTFLNLSAPSTTVVEGGDAPGGEPGASDLDGQEGGNLAAQLQPSAQAFQALVRAGGGQSLSSASKRRDLDYALKLTATSIPEHLQCGICHGIVKNAMLVPWDAEGRPTCESCIRDGLTKNGFTCPLTGTEGVSPDDLFPNVGLRKAADAFVKGVMEKMDSIERQIEAEEEEEARKRSADAKNKSSNNEFDDAGDGIVTGKKSKSSKKKSSGDDDLLFGGDDEFGGDVFDVASDEPEEPDEENNDDAIIEPKKDSTSPGIDVNAKKSGESKGSSPKGESGNNSKVDSNGKNATNDQQTNNETNVHAQSENPDAAEGEEGGGRISSTSPTKGMVKANVRKEAMKRRGPPVGYVLGPAGGVGGVNSPATVGMGHQQHVPPPPPPIMMGGSAPGRGPLMGRGVGGPHMPGPQFGDMGRGGGRGGPPGRVARFYPGQFEGRGGVGGGGRGFHPNQQPYPGGRGGGPPPSQQGFNPNLGGRGGGFHRNQQWGGDNNSNGDWNRKRPRDPMMEQQQGSPDNMYQVEPNQRGGRGPPGGRHGPGFEYQGRGGRGGYDPRQFQGGHGGGRFQGGRGDGGRGYNDFRGRGRWGGRGRY